MKLITCYVNRKNFAKLLEKMEVGFWNIEEYQNAGLRAEVAKLTHIFWTIAVVYVAGGTVLISGFAAKPLLDKGRQVPLLCWMPEGNPSPHYEIVYLMQLFVLFSVLVGVGGFDFFYIFINVVVSLQFKILKYELKHLVSNDDKETAFKLKKCVAHHQFLFEYTRTSVLTFHIELFLSL